MENQTIGFCVKCKMKREIANAIEGVTKNGKRVLKGICGSCGTKMFRFISGGIKEETEDIKPSLTIEQNKE